MATDSYISVGKLIDILKKPPMKDDMQIRVLTKARLSVGFDINHPILFIDIARESLTETQNIATTNSPSESVVKAPQLEHRDVGFKPREKAPRTGGTYWLEFDGDLEFFGTLKDLLAASLRNLEKSRPGTLFKLTQVKPRSKRIVAQDPHRLFDKNELVKEYSAPLMDGWWYGTNNSKEETRTWIRKACELAGLHYGNDLKASID